MDHGYDPRCGCRKCANKPVRNTPASPEAQALASIVIGALIVVAVVMIVLLVLG